MPLMRHLSWVSSRTEILHYSFRVDNNPVVTFEALQVYFLLILYFNLILQWVGPGNLTRMLQSLSLFPMLYYSVQVAFSTVGVILQLLTDHVTSTEEDEVLFPHNVYLDLRQQPPLLMLPPQAGFLRIL